MADRRRDSSRRPPDDRNNANLTDEQIREKMNKMKQQMADNREEHRQFMLKARDADEAWQKRVARNRPPPSRGWGSMSNPETASANDHVSTGAFPAAPNQDSINEHEARSPPSRERREDAERGSRDSQFALNVYCERVCPSKHAPRDPCRVL